MGYAVKLDTNGYNPVLLKKITDAHLVDYIAMDIKNSPARYGETVGIDNFNISPIYNSISIIMNSGIEYEFRTTVSNELHDEKDIEEIARMIHGAKRYFLQGYRDTHDIIDPRFSSPSAEKMQLYKNAFARISGNVEIRGE